MTVPYYPQITTTPNLGLSLIGMDEVVAEDMVLIDAALGNVSSTWNSIQSPTGPMALSMGLYTSDFNYTGKLFNVTSVDNTDGAGHTTYHGTFTGGDNNAFVGQVVRISGFTLTANNGAFLVTASTATTLITRNELGASETASAFAQFSGTYSLNNTAPATGFTGHSNSPILSFFGHAWNLPGISDPDNWSLGSVITGLGSTQTSTFTFTHVGDFATTSAVAINEVGSAALSPYLSLQCNTLESVRFFGGASPQNDTVGIISRNGFPISINSSANSARFAQINITPNPVSPTNVGTFYGVSFGDTSHQSPISVQSSSGTSDFVAVGIQAENAKSGTASGNFTGFQVNVTKGASNPPGNTYIADFQWLGGSAFQIIPGGANLPTNQFLSILSGATVDFTSGSAAEFDSGSQILDYNFSAGGANQVLTAGPSGGQVIWATISTTPPWSSLTNAAADLTLANAGFNTTFNQTSAVNWKWANTTAATGSVSQSSPILNINGTYWNGSASAADNWTIQNVVANGTNGASTLTFTHTGSSGTAAVQTPNTVTGNLKVTNIQGTSTLGGTPQWTWNPDLTRNGWYFNNATSGTILGTNVFAFYSGTAGGSALDTGISRSSAGVLAVGNGTAGDTSGSIVATNLGSGSIPASSVFWSTVTMTSRGGGPFVTDGSTGPLMFQVRSSKTVTGTFALNAYQLGWKANDFSPGSNLPDVYLSRTIPGALSLGVGLFDTTASLSLGNITGGCAVAALSTPSAPTVTAGAGSGATTWGYQVVAKDKFGTTVGSSSATVSNAASLTNTAWNKIFVNLVAGAAVYDVYRTTAGTSPSTTGKIGTLNFSVSPSATSVTAFDGPAIGDFGVLTLSSAANASGGNTVYNGTLTGLAVNAVVGCYFTVAGFTNSANNGGPWVCVSNTVGTITLANAAGVAETHAGTATQAGDGTTAPATNTTGTFKLTAGLMDSTASLGSSGNILTSTGTATQWVAPSTLGTNAVSIQGTSVSTVAPQTGDVLRYNEYGDSKWDLGPSVRPFIMGRADGHSASSANVGTVFTTYSVASSAAAAAVLPTATEPSAITIGLAASASANEFGIGEGNSTWTLGTFWRVSQRVKMNQTTNVRYWIGASSANPTGGPTFASDTPAAIFIGFRFSATTDTTIKAVVQTAVPVQTIVDTTVAPDSTNSHVYEFTYDGTNVNFYIDGVRRAQISTNLPATSQVLQSFICVDNKNTNNAATFNWNWSTVTLK